MPNQKKLSVTWITCLDKLGFITQLVSLFTVRCSLTYSDWKRFGFNPVTIAISYTTLTKFLQVNGRSGVSPQVEKLVSLGYIEAIGEGTSPKVFKMKLPIPHVVEGKK